MSEADEDWYAFDDIMMHIDDMVVLHLLHRQLRLEEREIARPVNAEAHMFNLNSALFFNQCRVKRPTFQRLVDWFISGGLIGVSSRSKVSLEARIYATLRVIGDMATSRNLQAELGGSGWTWSIHVNSIMSALANQFFVEHVYACDPNVIQDRISNFPSYAAFSNCIGAVDCCHIDVRIPASQQHAWRNRKSNITTNVFAACNFDLTFSYVLSGIEGSAHDKRVLMFAEANGFRMPAGKFMLGDQGFEGSDNILTPYPATIYHLTEWGNHRPQTAEQLFNLRHAKLRNVVERAFGLLKRKFASLRKSFEYPLTTQLNNILAATALHNFVLRDSHVSGFDSDRIHNHRNPNEVVDGLHNQLPSRPVLPNSNMSALRDEIARVMWAEYRPNGVVRSAVANPVAAVESDIDE